MPRTRLHILSFVAVLVLLSLVLGAQGALAVTFTHGVASGDVTPFSVLLWTRVDQEVKLTVEVSTDQTFATRTQHRTVLAATDNDFTAKVFIASLRPHHRYFYRWRYGDMLSEVGTFRTAQLPSVSAHVRFAYSGDSDGIAEVCQGDPLPTLPAGLRTQLGLPASPPPRCLEALFDPARTMLGPLQKAALKATLRHSSAKFKFIINEVPIQQFYGMPYDRWEGYGAERNEILSFIRDHHIEHVTFLTTDTHANLINQVFIDRFLAPEPIAQEFVTGPIATTTLQTSTLAAAGPAGLLGFNAILDLVGVHCRHLDAYSYGLVDVDVRVGTATVTLKDENGEVLVDQQNPAVLCTKTIAP